MRKLGIFLLLVLFCSCTQNISMYEDKIDTLTQQLEEMTSQRDDLQTKLTKTELELQDVNTTVKSKESEISILNQKISELEAEILVLQEQQPAEETNETPSEDSSEEFSSKIEQLSQEVESLKIEKSQLQAEVSRLESIRTQLESKVQSLTEELNSVKNDLSSKETLIEALTEELASTKSDLDSKDSLVENLISDLEEKAVSTQTEIDSKTEACSGLKANIQAILSAWQADTNFINKVTFDWGAGTVEDFIQTLTFCSSSQEYNVITRNFVIYSIEGTPIRDEDGHLALQGPDRAYYWGPEPSGTTSWEDITPKISWNSSILESWNDYINSQCSVNLFGLTEQEVTKALEDKELLEAYEKDIAQLEFDISVLSKTLELTNSELQSLSEN